jgi:hypothetical protein
VDTNCTVSYSLFPYNVTNTITTGAGIVFDPTNNIYRLLWTVPDPPARVRIAVRHNILTAFGDSQAFSICGGFRMVTPNGGEEFFALRPTQLRWETLGSVPAVDLYYSTQAAHGTGTWSKCNAAPIPNNHSNSLVWVETSVTSAIPYNLSTNVRFRVQDATEPQSFDPAVEGPFDDSDADLRIRCYSVHWVVTDCSTSNRVDQLSVVDSSGWSASGLSCISNAIIQDYPWGTWNTVWYRQYFHDHAVLNWHSENALLGGPAVWTQEVCMTRSVIEPVYHVMGTVTVAQAAVDAEWSLTCGGTNVTNPGQGQCVIYDTQGALVISVTNNAPDSNGVFRTTLDRSFFTPGVYFARLNVVYGGSTYSSGLIFTLQLGPQPSTAIIDVAIGPDGRLELQWFGTLFGTNPATYLVESCTNLPAGDWSSVAPTSQWCVSGTRWTNTGPQRDVEFFRVKAKGP